MARPLFAAGGHRVFEVEAQDVPAVQRFFEANPEYFHAVNGRAPLATEAEDEFAFQLPAEWPHDRKWTLAAELGGGMSAMAGGVTGLFAPDVAHIGLFIVATALHGSGAAQEILAGIERWLRGQGAAWIRLGVVKGNARAERFWESRGYEPVRERTNVGTGARRSDIRVLVKALAGGTREEYLARVARDRPESP